MNRILILTRECSDLSDLIMANCPGAVICDPFRDVPIETLDALCFLSGNEDRPVILPAALRSRVEAARAAGKPVFTERPPVSALIVCRLKKKAPIRV